MCRRVPDFLREATELMSQSIVCRLYTKSESRKAYKVCRGGATATRSRDREDPVGHEGWSERGKERKERATVTVCTLAFQSHEDESDMGREGGAAQGDSRCKGSKGPRATHEDEGERERDTSKRGK